MGDMRKSLIAKVHIGKDDLALTNEEWQNLILEISKNRTRTSKEMKIFELEELLKRLKGLGFQPKTREPSPEKIKENSDKFFLEEKLDNLLKILRLPRNYAVSMSKNMFQISNLMHLRAWQLRQLVQILEKKKLSSANENFFNN